VVIFNGFPQSTVNFSKQNPSKSFVAFAHDFFCCHSAKIQPKKYIPIKKGYFVHTHKDEIRKQCKVRSWDGLNVTTWVNHCDHQSK